LSGGFHSVVETKEEFMIPTRTNPKELPVFIGTDQPETCRKCGSRTDFDDIGDGLQLHRCMLCGNQYLVEFEQESPELKQ
jgi:hypothetical protein